MEIETAPKDGTEVLLTDGKALWVGEWVHSLNDKADAGWTAYEVQSWGYEQYAHIHPTHWQPKLPLPIAPSNTQEPTP